MRGLIDAALDRSRTVVLLLVLILATGAYAYVDIAKESDPDINIPILFVQMSHDGISPEDAERLLIRPMEQELRSVEGLKEMRSTGFEGGANIVLEFEAGFDADKAMDDVREQVDLAKTELPDETEEPTLHEVNFALFPVLVVILSGDVPERTLTRLADGLKDSLEGLASVLDVEIAGKREEVVEVVIDPVKVESYGLSPGQAVAAVSSSNLLVPAGAQDSGRGRFSVKVPGLFETVADVMDLPIVTDGDAVVRVGDVADVRRTFKDPEGFARVDGQPALALEVSKRTGENIIETIEAVRATVEAERAAWPEAAQQAVSVSYTQDRSSDIRTMLADLQNNVISAVLLVMVVVIAALGLRSAGLVGIAIPGSFLAAILMLYLAGMTINIVVLFSLILAVGMLVDGAIVVTEYADRKMSEGLHRKRAYGLAAKRMAAPVIASTATTLAAFLPLVFWPGVVGEFMKYLPLTVLATLVASLFMALVFVPTLGGLVGRAGGNETATLKAISADDHSDLSAVPGLTGGYLRVLRGALRHPGKVIAAAVALLIGVQALYAEFGAGVEFFPEVEPRNALLQVRARGNLSIHEKNALMAEVEQRILEVEGLQTAYARTGRARDSQEAEDIIGTVTLEMKDWQERRPASQILAEIRTRTADLAGIIIDARKQEEGPPVGKPVQVQLSSRHPELLAGAVETVLKGMEAIGGLTGIEDSRPLPGIDWRLQVDRGQASKFGADIGLVGNAVQMATTGLKLGEYRPDDTDDEVEIRARYPVAERTVDQLDRIRVSTANGAVPIANFVTRSAEPSVGTVKRSDGRRVMTVKADVADGVLPDTKVRALGAWLAEAGIDKRVSWEFKGEDEEQRKAEAFLGKAFLVALFLMTLILVTQFNSFYAAALILSAVVLSTVGVFVGLLTTGQPFGIVMNGIGVIALAGIVVNNNIVLIDTFDRLRRDGHDVLDAILRTGAQRMRPVLLTTVTTMLGLLPMMFGVNIDFIAREVTVGAPSTQWWSQLATAIVWGLGFATILTLVVTPCALMARDNAAAWIRRLRRRGADDDTLAPVQA